MGFKKLNKFQILTNGAMSSTNSIASAVQHVENFDNLGLEIVWTGTPTGTITILGAVNEDHLNPYSASNPIPAGNALTFSPALSQPAGSAGRYLVNLNQFPFPLLQIRYTNASGSGTLNVYLQSKDLN